MEINDMCKEEKWMQSALEEAKIAFNEGEIPIGAVVVMNNHIVGKGRNSKENKLNALEHAEMIALKQAFETVGTKYLDQCDLYVTLEPCMMCTGAIVNSRIHSVYFGAKNKRYAGMIVINQTFPKGSNMLNHYPNVNKGICEAECAQLLSDFFTKKRQEKKEAKED